MTRIEELLYENSNRPEIQEKIRQAAVKGAADEGFSLVIGYDNSLKFGDKETYENQSDALAAAESRIEETVNLD